MKLITFSRGIVNNRQLAKVLQVNKIYMHFSQDLDFARTDIFVGWGNKPNTRASRKLAKDGEVAFWTLEDGFIAYIEHPSKQAERLSLIKDERGIYYDSTTPSDLDHLLENQSPWFTSEMGVRSANAIQQCTKLGVSKYNQCRQEFPDWLQESIELDHDIILVIDQTFGDCSIVGAQAEQSDFSRMLDWAVEQSRTSKAKGSLVVIKTHPDVLLGKKRGYFGFKSLPDGVRLLSEDVLPKALISVASCVATVSSQLGFEALWYGKPVHCFGIPFYAQRGLTIDHARFEVKRTPVSLHQLFAAAVFQYPLYWHPEKQCLCEFEEILEWMQAQIMARKQSCSALSVIATSLWKRSFLPAFIGPSANKIRFSTRGVGNVKELHWGMKTSPVDQEHDCWRMEDGFIRSVGLGADLRRPCSLVLDDVGIYYNGHAPSRLEDILNKIELNEFEKTRAQRLFDQVIDSNITKYNIESSDLSLADSYKEAAVGKEILLVVGQFQEDLSIQFGAATINTNLGLLRAVRARFPDAYLIYKEHPDVYSGVRLGKLDDHDVLQWADAYVTDLPITVCFSFIDRLCTICSLSGFEALLRGVVVSTFGLPFYAGWGLTDDALDVFSRRKRTLGLLELVYGVLVLYPRYVNWDTRTLSTPEIIIDQLIQERDNTVLLKPNWMRRQVRKVRYLWEALIC
ncbi:MAG: capsule biosynthesis protein [Moraxellaceae bacterium]|nr:MAG: capsule biosynthesis protein [Moraxellaceae bacterium]